MSLFLKRMITASALGLLFMQLPALAAPMDQQHKMHGKMDHSNMDHSQMNMQKPAKTMKGMTQTQPKEPGQGAFATIAEIVVLLTNDPKTDWSKVNIDALRDHLIDMDELVLRANSKMTASHDKIVFTVTGSGRTLKAIHTMVPAHSGVLTRTTDWKIKAEMTSDGAIMTITSDAPGALKKAKALGFFGVMATGAHHQPHHFAMAKGATGHHAHAHN